VRGHSFPPEGTGDANELLKTKPNTATFWSGKTDGVGGAEKSLGNCQAKWRDNTRRNDRK